MSKYVMSYRKKVTRNTDPQRRCYDGCHFSSVEEWSNWALVCAYSSREIAEDSAATFKRINPKREYKIDEVNE